MMKSLIDINMNLKISEFIDIINELNILINQTNFRRNKMLI